jgi:antitoxin (DNA-binding transcriptional repressor) of toxin-antitoxin stability system
MHTVTLEYAQSHLAELFEEAGRGEEVCIENGTRAVRMVPTALEKPTANAGWPLLGRYEGQGWMAPDFDAIPDDFAEYVK